MNFQDYQAQAATYVSYPPEHESDYLLLGLVAEVGELLGKYAKALRGDAVTTEQRMFEMGDVLWMHTNLVRQHGRDGTCPRMRPETRDLLALMFKTLFFALQHNAGPSEMLGVTQQEFLDALEALAVADGYTFSDAYIANLEKLERRRQTQRIHGNGDDR